MRPKGTIRQRNKEGHAHADAVGMKQIKARRLMVITILTMMIYVVQKRQSKVRLQDPGNEQFRSTGRKE